MLSYLIEMILFFVSLVVVYYEALAAQKIYVQQYVNGGRIVGGEYAEHAEFPFMVSIQRLQDDNETWRQHCGGSIVSPTVVLTACHCVNVHATLNPFILFDPKTLRVVAGVGDVSQLPNSQVIAAKQIIAHPECANSAGAPFISDSAILVLQSPLVLSAEVQPLKVVSNDPQTAGAELMKLQKEEATCIIAGWGRTEFNLSEYGPKMKTMTVTAITSEKCQATLCELGAKKSCDRDFSKLHQFCAVGDEHSSICFADSGGPIVCNGLVYGTVSYGTPKCPRGWPGVYTDIVSILYLINKYGSGEIDDKEGS